MKTIETQIWLTNPEEAGRNNAWYTAYSGDMAGNGWHKVCDHDIEFEEPTATEVARDMVPILRAKKAAIRVRAEEHCADLEQQIQNLLAITYDDPEAP